MSSFLQLFLIISAFNAVLAQQNLTTISLSSSLTPITNSSWPSSSGRYAFGFYPQRNGFSVGIFLAGIPEKTVVWTAIRDQNPVVSSDAVLSLTGDGRLVLRQDQGLGMQIANLERPAASASMLDNGNFVLYASNQIVIWQSFDYPTDTLVPGQRLLPGMALFSSASVSDYSRGIFQLVMQNDGNLVQYPATSPIEAPYAYYTAETAGAGNNVSLNLEEDGRLYLLNGSSLLKNISRGGSPAGSVTLMRIDADGIFRIYSRSLSSDGNWIVRWSSTQDKCVPKGLCGINSFCTQMDEGVDCVCLPGFDFVQPGNKTEGCAGDIVLGGNCKIGEQSVQYDFIMLEGILWEDNPYAVLDISVRESCREACLDDCLCQVAFFKNGKCRKQKLPLRFGRKPQTDSNVAFVRITEIRPQGKTVAKKEHRLSILITGIALIAAAIMILALSWIYVRRSHAGTYRKISHSVDAIALTAFSYEDLVRATNDFKEELGRGSSGTVFKGTFQDCGKAVAVAVKRLEKEFAEGENEFQTELKVIGRTHHRNLVRLIGYCIDESRRLLVFEYMSNGSLAGLLYQNQNQNQPSWEERIKMARDIARGILYLHEECETQIIHCDIKPQNILIGEHGCAKISDFGLAKLLKQDQTNTFTAIRGTRGYVAPEWHKNQRVTVKADVYSYGIVLLEVVFCRKSVDLSLSEEEAVLEECVSRCYGGRELRKLVQVDEVVDEKELERMVKIALWCVQDEPALRPSMKKVVLMLEGTVEIPHPPSPSSFSSLTL